MVPVSDYEIEPEDGDLPARDRVIRRATVEEEKTRKINENWAGRLGFYASPRSLWNVMCGYRLLNSVPRRGRLRTGDGLAPKSIPRKA